MPEDFMEEIYKWALECKLDWTRYRFGYYNIFLAIGLLAIDKKLGCLEHDLPEDSDQKQLIVNSGRLLKYMMETEVSFPTWKIIPNKPYKALREAHTILNR